MHRHPWLIALSLLAASAALAAPAPPAAGPATEEVLRLDSLADPGHWQPSECTVTVAADQRAAGQPTLHVHIPVDHHAGEAKYPIGWPRLYCALREGAERSWSEYDRFEFMILAKMTRTDLPKAPLNLQIHCPARPATLDRALAEIRLDEWVQISIPTAAIPQVERVAQLGLNISESNYRDQEVLDFYLGAFRLVRSLDCRVERLTLKAAAVFADRAVLPVELVVAGPPPMVSRGVPFTLRCGERVLRTETLPVRRGSQVLDMDIAELRLAPGEYSLAAFDDDPQRRQAATFRVVTSPWTEP